ncbi:ABC transporter [Candidatus Methylacidiphilum fumarolicum]|uniref:ABC-type transport system involved in gliding motility, ATPase component n=2 Tax=Candidatus Methylacidiphilum fumarolicum TaxID=591154 RepID=I0K019_METFB|nr:ATP-binding cassette domain-containing protein [Candidatus Methylacidiphilum fumarolicum]MBW6415137.1 ATP-binding cassette domain-containing protein [Candidatus Methylacidiphilum fumarolicum]TFE65983.1 ABC transporter [Candidatus Methylacidiphilum fumarolicum]TFE72712.1 ABC transporter [Candidatus Methylacidiphilum fumarolicum]TFE73178.1 ABC transporter [Candidatus Methylacidiphilum fumarolicum]TFE77583.1 ABC transporter [Candidatus Methylacidiphilum fumarolicum]
MIKVENLIKTYSGYTALQGISFEVKKGEIVGFLGPNGAGKTTTMRILSCYLPPTSGKVEVAGFDVLQKPLEVKKRVGYMPENVPLYTDLRVNEYLRYRAKLKGIRGSMLNERVQSVLKLCHIEDVASSMIGNLSKGYRQRVGLADALVHDPELLILDEPTIGLDPNQIRSVRELIRSLGQHHTIILSSHILSEVEAVCSRVLIINKGKIEAADTPENLSKLVRGGNIGAIRLEILCKPSVAKEAFERLEEVEEAEIVEEYPGGWVILQVWPKPGNDIRDGVYNVIQKNGWKIREMSRIKATLEDIFVELTQD